jgi:phage repressor protein C with HTH and peptisase S24 domain
MQTLQERMAEVFPDPRQHGLQAEIVRLCKVSRPTVSAWFNNPDKVGTISRTHAELICSAYAPGVSPAWLAEGVLPKTAQHSAPSPAPLFSARDSAQEVTLKQYAVGGSMGKGLVLQGDQPGIIRNMSVTREWAQKNLRANTGLQNLCIVTGFGDSMKPLFNPGDPLIVDQGVKTCEVDAVYFFRVGDEGFIKRLQRVPGEGVWALSANKEYKDWLIEKGADFEVFGRVLKAWKGEDL